MNAFETLIYEKEGPLALVTLNRPRFLNAYNIQMRDDLFEVLNAIRDDDEVRVALVKGAGEKAFCAGADLSEFLTAPPPVIIIVPLVAPNSPAARYEPLVNVEPAPSTVSTPVASGPWPMATLLAMLTAPPLVISSVPVP